MSAASLAERILTLKRDLNAVILVHNYQRDEVQEIADFLGDSLDLSRKAARTPAEIIVFCGVHFMAETAAILCPDRLVLLPDLAAGCPMADMITPEALRELKREHPAAIVAAYVNTSAAVKAEADICVTSANAAEIVSRLPADREIIFIPDQYLAAHVSKKTGRKLIAWPGYCPTHVGILYEDIEREKRLHPGALVMVHPECPAAENDAAEEVLSTSGMVRFARESSAREFIVGTEVGLISRLKRENPEKVFYPATERAVCPNMKRITLEKVLWSLEDRQFEIKVPEEIRVKAKRAVDAMLA
ncbi:MAG: quinolinate synthase NadA [Candidatus Aureabacteria bacterium]|nr:quinolinate synthase NadA [Candidatus Auribacterota bacterium]